MAKIYIIEDEVKIRSELVTLLTRYGYDCSAAETFDGVVSGALGENPQLILLDINLPMFDGYHICREIRKVSEVPIIVVTSRNSELDELMSMNLGADDFVTKPYNTQILLARISSVLRRSEPTDIVKTVEYRGVSLNLSKGTVSSGGKEVELTKNELRILHLLIKNKGNILSREDIMNELWQSDEFVDDNTLTVNINRLRRKLEDIDIKDYLVTKRGQGYMI